MKNLTVLEILGVAFVALWLVGLASSYTFGGFIHLLLVLAVVVLLLRFFQGRRIA